MPLSNVQTPPGHRSDPTLPIPVTLRAAYSARTQSRQALADWLQRRYAHHPEIKLRPAALRFFREIGLLAPTQRWVNSAHLIIADLVGVACAHFLRTAGTTTTEEALARLRGYREPNDPHTDPTPELSASIPDTPPSDLLPSPAFGDAELTPGEVRQAVRLTQRTNRSRFAEFLRTRRGLCNPRRVYRQWCTTFETALGADGFVVRGLRPYRRTSLDALDRLGPTAAPMVDSIVQIDRAVLADQLEKI
jgi:hypothetical protein